MGFYELAKERFSVRKYKDIPIEDEKLQKILEAGVMAPTAGNRQPYRIYVVKSEEKIKALREATPMAFNAPVVFAVCVDQEAAWHSPFEEDYNTYDIDGSSVISHLMLQAWELGIGSCWVRKYEKEKVRQALGIPENMTIMSLLPIGYADDGAVPAPKHFENKAFDELVEFI